MIGDKQIFIPSSGRQLRRWIATFLLVSLVADQLVGRALDRIRPRVLRGATLGAVNLTLAAAPSVLIVGSSAAIHSFDDEALTSILGMPVHNAGADGRGIVFGRGLLSLVCRRRQLVVLVVDVKRNVDEVDRAQSSLAPFMEESPIIREILDSNWRSHIMLLSRSFRYNAAALPALASLFSKSPISPWGFVPLSGTYDAGAQTFAAAPSDTDRDWDWYGGQLARLVEEGKACGAKLLFVESPVAVASASPPKVSELFREAAAKNEIEYLDLTAAARPEFANPSLYYDAGHLNDRGAIITTRYLAVALEGLLGQPPRSMSIIK